LGVRRTSGARSRLGGCFSAWPFWGSVAIAELVGDPLGGLVGEFCVKLLEASFGDVVLGAALGALLRFISFAWAPRIHGVNICRARSAGTAMLSLRILILEIKPPEAKPPCQSLRQETHRS
jgi:hypothetical protein